MPKENNTLFQALQSRKGESQSQEKPKIIFQKKQVVDISTDQVPSLKDKHPGDQVTLYFTGTVQTKNINGSVRVAIENFTEEEQEEEEEKEEKEEKEIPMVRTTITPSPGAV